MLSSLIPLTHGASYYDFTVRDAIVDHYNPRNGSLSALYENMEILGTDISFHHLRKEMVLVNDQFPGPPIEVNEDEIFEIRVRNELDIEETAIHFHGLYQYNNSQVDGAYGLNSCGVEPRMEQTYRVVAAPCGTRFYHGHSGRHFMKGLVGPLIIHCRDDPYLSMYSEERYVTIFENWYDNMQASHTWSAQRAMHPLVNGKHADGTADFTYPEINVIAGKCYRFRFLQFFTAFWEARMTLHGHTAQVIAFNGELFHPPVGNVSTFQLYVAERIDFLLCADAPVGRYLMQFGVGNGAASEATIRNMYAVLAYHGSDPANGITPSVVNGVMFNTYDQTLLVKPVLSASKPIETLLPDQHVKFQINVFWDTGYNLKYTGPSAHMPEAAMLTQRPWEMKGESLIAKCKNNPEAYADPVYTFHERVVLDMLFTNTMAATHSIHLHGHDVYTVAQGNFVDAATNEITKEPSPLGFLFYFSVPSPEHPNIKDWCDTKYMVENSAGRHILDKNPDSIHNRPHGHGQFFTTAWACTVDPDLYSNTPINTETRISTDIVPVKANLWAIARVKLNNPGIWPFHCHQQMHVRAGMMVVFDVLPNEQSEVPARLLRNCPCVTPEGNVVDASTSSTGLGTNDGGSCSMSSSLPMILAAACGVLLLVFMLTLLLWLRSKASHEVTKV
jgi:FtsP/CotA-like multicopper oxidase with cupredoxin domain